MTKPTTLLIVAALLAAVLAPAAHAKSAPVLLQEGLYAEEVEGNLDSAIGIYQQIIEDSTAPKNLVAQALYRQGTCFLKKKNEAEFPPIIDLYVEITNDKGESVTFSWVVLDGRSLQP